MNEYRPSHINVKDVIAFAFLKMKEYYDSRYQAIFFQIGDLVNLRLYRGYQVSAITSKKIESQLIEPFKVLKRIGRLAYKLELLLNIRIHDVVFVTYLKSATDPAKDLYRRRRLLIFTIIVEGEEEYEIEKLLRKRITRRNRG